MAVVPSKKNDYPPYMYDDGDRGGFVVINPISNRKQRFAASEKASAEETALLLVKWVRGERHARLMDSGKPKIAGVVEGWKRDRLPFMPWDDSTRKAHLWKLERIKRELGDRYIARTDCVFLTDWLVFCKTADAWNKWRYDLILLWQYAVSKNLTASNEPEKILDRSTSKKLEINRKVRQPLDVEGFVAIYDKAPTFLQIAMDQSLITLQARTEICNIEHAHYRDGYLYTIREKTSGDSDMAFIRIEITEELDAIRRRSLMVDGVTHLPSSRPFLVHRSPDRERRQWTEGKPHWTYVNPEYLSKAFADARDQVERFKAMDARRRPTFHEIRGLGSRLQKQRGRSKADIQKLMTHTDQRATAIYLQGGASALRDEDYVSVSAPFTRAELLR